MKKFWIVVAEVQGANPSYNLNTRFDAREDAIARAGELAAKTGRKFVLLESTDVVETVAPPLKVIPIRG